MLQFKDCAGGGLYQRLDNYGFNDMTSSWVNTAGNKNVNVYDTVSPSGYLWQENGVTRSAYVGDGNNDRASAFLTYC